MRWKLCKLFGKKPSDEFFEGMSTTELFWMDSMMQQDELESFEEKKAFTEYLASFINPQAVREIKNMANNTNQVSDEDFAKTLEQLLGGTLDPGLLRLLNKG